MSNPVLVEVIRGGLVESRHRGAVAVVEADGAAVLAVGDVARPVFPRSAIKPLPALPFVESGAADRYVFGDEELALACASHSGEPAHVEGVARMLAKAGLDVTALACGTHWPSSHAAVFALARTGAPSALHNNLLRQACRLSLRRLRDGSRSRRLLAGGARGAARGACRSGGFDRRGATGRLPGDRRLLGADMGNAAAKSRGRFREIRHWARPWI